MFNVQFYLKEDLIYYTNFVNKIRLYLSKFFKKEIFFIFLENLLIIYGVIYIIIINIILIKLKDTPTIEYLT